MYRWTKLPVLIILLGGFTSQLFAQHTITKWPDNKSGAVSITFDDGLPSQLSGAVPALNVYGMKGTFFVITDNVTAGSVSRRQFRQAWDAWRDVAAMGHEIGSHTKSHPNLKDLLLTDQGPAQLQEELSESKAIIDEQIPSQKCLALAYPYGSENSEVEAAAAKYYMAARNTNGDLNNPDINFDFMSITGDGDDANDPEQMKDFADIAESEGKWHVSYFHGLDGLGDEYGEWDLIGFYNYLDYLDHKSLWVATISDAVKFIKERDSAKLSVVNSTKSHIKLRLTDSLDNDLYDQPLTIRSEVPASWPLVTIEQGKSDIIKTPVVEADGEWVVYYQAMPDQGLITLAPASKWEKHHDDEHHDDEHHDDEHHDDEHHDDEHHDD